jgi:hypothetical protein
MLIARRQHAAAPLCDLNLTESLRLRRRHGRTAYLLALLTERRGKRDDAARFGAQAHPERATAQAARTLPS